MDRLIRRAVALGACALLMGCSHQLTLTPQDGIGPMGRGTAPSSWSGHGTMSAELAGKRYAGEWTLQDNDGVVGFGTAYSGTQVATATMVGASTSGNGKAYLTEASGGSLSCDFGYNSMSATGLGVCRTEAGKLYNLQIH